MIEKSCFKCGVVKPLIDFYKNKGMADGRLGKCKECARADSLRHRWENIEAERKRDRKRGSRQDYEYTKEYRQKNPMKYAATSTLNNAKNRGKIKPTPCNVCGTTIRIEAHHPDYSKPLDVVWLCSVHHKAEHFDIT